MKNLAIIAVIIIAGYLAYHFLGPASSDEVLLFVVDGCSPCNDVADFLDENEVEYIKYNINESEENKKLYKKFGGNSAYPMTVIGDKKIKGSDLSMLEIAIAGLYELDDDDKEVVMYVKQGCGWCTKAAEFLKEHNIKYTEYDIGASEENMSMYQELKGSGTPLIYVGNIRISGFNQKMLKMALEQVELM